VQDTFIYNGAIERQRDLEFIEMVAEKRAGNTVNLVLVTGGGDPDAAFKMSRYLQSKYERFTITVSGLCKSAGTLLALGANEIVFAPYGELGPLDVQMLKVDNIAGMESGLNISEAFQSLELRARNTFTRMVTEILSNSGGVISFQTAARTAVETISALYGPIFSRIDPEEVGSRSRAMRIGQDYGRRLNAISQNLRENALLQIAQTYSSHGFVIDLIEARSLFQNVREANAQEIQAIVQLGPVARMPGSGFFFDKIDWPEAQEDNLENPNAEPQPAGDGEGANPEGNGQNPA
jgi:hypothetical protein